LEKLMPRPRPRLPGSVFHLAACLALALAASLSGGPAAAQAPAKQVGLTEKQVQGFIAAQKPMTGVTEKMQGRADKPDPKVQARLEAIAKKYGFRSFGEYDDVAAAISLVMTGIDPETRKYTPADVAVRQQIADVEADTAMAAAEKQQMLERLNEALKQPQPVPNPANIALVKKYYDKIEAALQ
jgi:hypothetical protein